MFVIKRDGERQPVHFDKITKRLASLCAMDPAIGPDVLDPTEIALHVIQGLKSGMKTSELDSLASETLAYKTIDHPAYGALASRIEVSNLHKNTSGNFAAVTRTLHEAGLLSEAYAGAVFGCEDQLCSMIDYSRDYAFDYFGIKTLVRSYLVDVGGAVAERPQDMWMRVAVQLNVGAAAVDLEGVKTTYDLLSQGYYTHATPTLFSAGMKRAQMSSCFLLTMKEDSIGGIFDTLKQCALISKYAGGIGLDITKVRATSSYIHGTNGKSNGIVPMLRIFNNTARYVDQGGGKRKGSFAMYIEPWHADVEDFLELKKNHGKEESRARDLFYALWIPDLFMKRVQAGGAWSLFCPDECPGLATTFGEAFEELYERYEREGKARKVVPAMVLWQQVLTSQVETGTPYILYKDHINHKSQQANIGMIHSSNLCAEIVEHTSPDEVAVCNLASINLSRFVEVGQTVFSKPFFDLDKLRAVTRTCVRNLNRVIDGNYYPVDEALRSNSRHRPVGLGVQGLADVFAKLLLPFDDPQARLLNRRIFEHMYFAALQESCELAKAHGPYDTFEGSPASRGLLQFDLWAARGHFDPERMDPDLSERWKALKKDVVEFGLRNSLLIALMPTASTSQILGNNECFEPFTNNIYSRRTLAGEFMVANKHLQRELLERRLWNREFVERLLASNGSVQGGLVGDPLLAQVFRTVWEIPQKSIVDMALERGPFVDQTQSMNIFMAQPTASKLNSMHFYGWRNGIKTGSYYVRTQSSARAIQFTVGVKDAAAAEGADVCESCTA
jgi:ribonucleoside-diphosphate reductase alpha chain